MRLHPSRIGGLAAVALAVLGVGAAQAAKPTGPVYQFKASAANVKEGGGNVVLTVVRSAKGTTGSVTVSLTDNTAKGGASCVGSTGNVDFNNTGFPLVVNFGTTDLTKTVTVPICNDDYYEGNESFTASLSANSNGTIGAKNNVSVNNIQDNDVLPTIAIADASDDEGQTLHFSVSLTGNHAVPVSVHWATADGTALSTEDYTSGSGNLAWAPGDNTAKDVTVATQDDGKYANPDEYFYVNLSSPYNGSFGDNQAKGTLNETDDEPAFSVDDPSADEDAGTLTFTLSLDTASDTDAKVDWETNDGTAVGGASCGSGVDYVTGSGTATVTAGSTTTTVDVTICDDGVYADPDETFTLDLSTPVDATISDNQGTGTLVEQDAEPNISVDDPTAVVEGNTITFTVSIDATSDTDVTVDWTTTAGTAVGGVSCGSGADYVSDSDTATIAAGSTSTTVDVTTCDDGADEGTQSFTVDLSGASGGTITDSSGTGTIDDNVT
jgi:hypothetical protein